MTLAEHELVRENNYDDCEIMEEEKCRVCGKEIKNTCHAFCSRACLEIHTTQQEGKQEKHEEIRRKAWEIYKIFVIDPRFKSEGWSAGECFNDAWYLAEGFCSSAKEKEGDK